MPRALRLALFIVIGLIFALPASAATPKDKAKTEAPKRGPNVKCPAGQPELKAVSFHKGPVSLLVCGDKLRQRRKGRYARHWWPVNGVTLSFNRNGLLREEIRYVTGHKHGPYKKFHDDGKQLQKEGTYKNGSEDGAWTKWHNNGKKAASWTAVKGVKHGRYTQWAFEGVPISEGDYDNGKQIGVWKTYYAGTKQLKEQVSYEAGKKHGKQLSWHDNGKTEAHILYVKGAREGRATSWHSGGGKRDEGDYKGGVKRGKWAYWWPGGAKKKEETYAAKGKIHGPYTAWRENGKVEEKGQYAGGKKSGLWTRFRADGSKMVESTFKDGEEHGLKKEFTAGGVLRASCEVRSVDVPVGYKRTRRKTMRWGRCANYDDQGKFKDGACWMVHKLPLWSVSGKKAAKKFKQRKCTEPGFLAAECKALCSKAYKCELQQKPKLPVDAKTKCVSDCTAGMGKADLQRAGWFVAVHLCKKQKCGYAAAGCMQEKARAMQ